MRRRRARRRGRSFLLLFLAVLSVIAGLLASAAGLSRPEPPPTAAINGPPALKERAKRIRPSRHAPPPGIELFARKPVQVRFKNPPRAAILFDVNTGQVLWARRPLRRLPIASVTKIMTALITVEQTGRGETARITNEAVNRTGSGVGLGDQRKRRVPVEALLAGMLLPSGNDAAVALAGHLAGDHRRFVRVMNRRARQLGLGCTRYASADGLADGNRSCPADLAALARLAIVQPRIVRLTRRKQVHFRFPNKDGVLWLNSTNPLLQSGYPGTIGLKTGYTQQAGRSFVGVARRGNHTYGVVLLNSPDTGGQAAKLLDAAFAMHQPKRRAPRRGDVGDDGSGAPGVTIDR